MYSPGSVRELLVEQPQLCYILFGSILAYAGWCWLLRPSFLNAAITNVVSKVLNVCSINLFISVSGSLSNEDSTILPDDIPSTTLKRASRPPVSPTAGPTDRAIRESSSTVSRTAPRGLRSMGRFTASGLAPSQKCTVYAPKSTRIRTNALLPACSRSPNISSSCSATPIGIIKQSTMTRAI